MENNNNKKVVWIINHYARKTEHRHSEIAEELAQRGIKTIVIASAFSHSTLSYSNNDQVTYEEVTQDFIYVTVCSTPAYSHNGGRRFLNMISFAMNVKRYANRIADRCGKPDLIVGSSVHPFVWETAYSLKKKFDSRFVAEIRDLWPLSLVEIAHMKPSSLVVKLLSIVERRAYRRSDHIFTTMKDAWKYIVEICPDVARDKVTWVPNALNTNKAGSEEGQLLKELDEYLQNNWCCIYTGSLVESECVPFLIEAVSLVRERGVSGVSFVIIGAGMDQSKIESLVKEKNMDYVKLFPRISKSEVMLALKKAGVCLAAHHNYPIYSYGLSMNKLNDYLYSKTPTIFACDAPSCVSENASGITMPYGNAGALADSIIKVREMSTEERKKMGDRAAETIRRSFSYAHLADLYQREVQGNESY